MIFIDNVLGYRIVQLAVVFVVCGLLLCEYIGSFTYHWPSVRFQG